MLISAIVLTIFGLLLAGGGAWLLVRLEFRSKGTLMKYWVDGEAKHHFEQIIKKYPRVTRVAVKAGINLFSSKDITDMAAPDEFEAFSHRFWGTLFVLLGTFLQVCGAYLAIIGQH